MRWTETNEYAWNWWIDRNNEYAWNWWMDRNQWICVKSTGINEYAWDEQELVSIHKINEYAWNEQELMNMHEMDRN